jgi:hypothetical protein
MKRKPRNAAPELRRGDHSVRTDIILLVVVVVAFVLGGYYLFFEGGGL